MIALLLCLALQDKPNIVVVFCDDLGYGDLGCFGHPTIRTPNLDRLAAEGQKWTSFYAASPVCTPSRAALLTGPHALRSGMASPDPRVLFPDSKGGLPPSEITVAELLKTRGYATACVGKWHLGHLPEYLPTRQGFDRYFGIPYSNDMDLAPGAPPMRKAVREPKSAYWNVPLMRNEEILRRAPDQSELTRLYTEEAVKFIREKKDGPFFLYLAHSLPHVPLFRSKRFEGASSRGLYGDVVEEIDWSVGELVRALKESGVDKNTLVLFTSDNGPWLVYDEFGGSAGPLKDGKGGTWEGGMRVPGIFSWPGRIAPGTVDGIGCATDLLATAARLAGAELPSDRELDSVDLAPALFDGKPSPRDTMVYYRDADLYAVRKGPWKAHVRTKPSFGPGPALAHDPPLLYHLGVDPGEKRDVASQHPAIAAELKAFAEAQVKAVKPGPNQLERR
ncbi:MAG TPA: sulfatase [Planctomycetota bacterium]